MSKFNSGGSKPGASSYERGDCGGAYGDYDHGVSEKWVKSRARNGGANSTPERVAKHKTKVEATATRAWSKNHNRPTQQQRDVGTKAMASSVSARTGRTVWGQREKSSGWAKWRAKMGK